MSFGDGAGFGRTMILLVAVLVFSGGCAGEKLSESDAAQHSNMRALAVAYGQFTSQNRGRVPKSEADLRKFIEKNGPDFLTSLGVETIDDMFVSTRDKEPYVVIYGKPSKVVAYEAVGVNGKRFIAGDIGDTREVTEEEFQTLVPNAK